MNTLYIPKLKVQQSFLNTISYMIGVPTEIRWYLLGCLNWKEFPCCPQTAFQMAHDGEHLFIVFQATERFIRAVTKYDNGNVWEDSCVEFFVSPDNDDTYYNFECNCTGKLLIEYGKVGQRERAPKEVLMTVKRWSSLGGHPFYTKEGRTWRVALSIPVTAFYHHKLSSFDGMTMKANFYKCGDKTPLPHFISFFPIDLPKPNFHCPEFFGKLQFD